MYSCFFLWRLNRHQILFCFSFFFQIVLKLTLVLLELYDILFPLYLFNEVLYLHYMVNHDFLQPFEGSCFNSGQGKTTVMCSAMKYCHDFISIVSIGVTFRYTKGTCWCLVTKDDFFSLNVWHVAYMTGKCTFPSKLPKFMWIYICLQLISWCFGICHCSWFWTAKVAHPYM